MGLQTVAVPTPPVARFPHQCCMGRESVAQLAHREVIPGRLVGYFALQLVSSAISCVHELFFVEVIICGGNWDEEWGGGGCRLWNICLTARDCSITAPGGVHSCGQGFNVSTGGGGGGGGADIQTAAGLACADKGERVQT